MTDPLAPLDGHPGPARPISKQRAHQLVRGVISRLIAGPVVQRPRPVATRRPALGVAAALLAALFCGAVAASLSGVRLWPNPHDNSQLPAAGKTAASDLGTPTTASTPAHAPPIVEPTTTAARPPSGKIDHRLPPRLTSPANRHRTSAKTVAATAVTSSMVAANEGPRAGVASDARVAGDALTQANRLRAQKQWPQAARAYQEIAINFAGSDTAYVAMVARGQLLLDHLHQPGGALVLFREALAQWPQGPLTEEARYNIAVCYRRLGDVENERAALKLFLSVQQPNPRHAAAAARLSELRR